MHAEELLKTVLDVLENRKGQYIKSINVQGKTSITDFMVFATGTSHRHIHALSEYIIEAVKAKGHSPLGVEGEQNAEWVLVDLGDVILHLMTAQTREFYQLEKLWDPEFSESEGLMNFTSL